jgi:N-acylneuraminate cytidylyltransferase
VVSSDDTEILGLARELEVNYCIERPAALASDTATSLEVVIHTVQTLKEQGQEYDAVCLLQATTPFRVAGLIDKAINTYKYSETDSLVSVLPVPEEYNPHWVFEANGKGHLNISTGEKEIITRRQDLAPAFIRDGALYITNISVLLSQKSLYGNSIGYIVSDTQRHVNIDTMADWERAEAMIKNELS